jgi:nicotinic acid mononucleotide adenylyltransferase
MVAMTAAEVHKELLEDPKKMFICQGGKHDGCFRVKYEHLDPDGGIIGLIPGSFNPIHKAHLWLYRKVIEDSYRSSRILYEMSITRVDKDPVSVAELETRLAQFTEQQRVLITNAPRMIHKIAVVNELMEGSVRMRFFVGMDTILRMAQDYSLFGIGGLHADFVLVNRNVAGTLVRADTFCSEKDCPKNVFPFYFQPPEELSKISSSAIRKELEDKQKELSQEAVKEAWKKVREDSPGRAPKRRRQAPKTQRD